MATHPASHDEAVARVLQVVDLMAARPDISDEDVVAALVRDGVGEVDAELLVRFVPCGMAFALLRLAGLKEFPSTFQIKNAAGGWVELPLSTEHYFSAALVVGFDVTTRGYTDRITKEVFTTVTMRSAEMNAVNRYFESEGTREGLAGSTFSPPTFIGITAEQIAASR